MAENKVYLTCKEEGGDLHIAEDVIAAIAADAALEVEGVRGLMGGERSGRKVAAKSVSVEMGEENILTVRLAIMVSYGSVIPEVASAVQQAVYTAIPAMTGFSVGKVDVHVGGIAFDRKPASGK
jgi:uncharacterized alkaline shock family protein YloU